LLFGHERISEPDLQIPHPRIAERPFVMAGLEEVGARP
jgi:7,8-dihydro-6-hydroxymethylpterin-pyrophosphokinase